jgi:SAM-dependent methyltransferase
MGDPRTQLVADCYDAIGDTFSDWRERIVGEFRLTGVDISPRQIERSRAAILEAELLCADLTELELPAGSFEAVVAFYVFNHVPRDLLAPLLARIHAWLAADGLLLTAFGVSDTAGWTGEFLGAETFFSSFERETNSRLVREAGFEPVRDEVVTFDEPEGPASFQWVLAHRRSLDGGGRRAEASARPTRERA